MSAIRCKSWPYGAVKSAEIVIIERVRIHRGYEAVIAGCAELLADGSRGEGFIIAGDTDLAELAVGDRGTITFRPGGPTGGYWDFRRDEP